VPRRLRGAGFALVLRASFAACELLGGREAELPALRRFSIDVNRDLARTRRYGGSSALLMLHIDGLNAINDAHGRPAGDAAIKAVAQLLRGRARSSDIVARIGGDELAVFLHMVGVDEAMAVAEALLGPVRAGPASAHAIGLSIGIATTGQVEGTTAELLRRADAARRPVTIAGGNGYALARRQR
jgi:diguanylate cyclase (GGDEF)-like protein